MKKVLFLFFLFFQVVYCYSKPVLLFPAANSKFNKTTTGISIKVSSGELSSFLNNHSIIIRGSKSGIHNFTLKILTESSIISVIPVSEFSTSEVVSVSIKSSGAEIFNFSFETEKEKLRLSAEDIFKKEINENQSKKNETFTSWMRENSHDTLPPDFPAITILNSVNPSPGFIFLSNFPFVPISFSPYLMALDNTGYPVFYKRLDGKASDFKKQPDGNFSYFDWNNQKHFIMNSSYSIIDTVECGNGYITDQHEFRILPNGHYIVISYDQEIVNMRGIVPNGDSTAHVVGLILQELDAQKNVVFQWRSWDHFHITDATHEDLTAEYIDYVHGNAVEIDTDGNLLLSSRHMDEITKINRNTGEIIWRLGGSNNEFTFINDPDKFSHQHAIRRLANGNITLFDNGNFHSPNYSRAVEYKLNEVQKTAELVWQYRNSPEVYSQAMGYVQRLPNGNTLIGWGAVNPSVTEVNHLGEKVFELSLPADHFSYRAYRSDLITEESETITPLSYNLYQNYPNPFNPETNIKFDIARNEDVKISVFNVVGQKVFEYNRNQLPAGSYSVNFNASQLSSGVYFYQIQTASFNQTKKMLLVK